MYLNLYKYKYIIFLSKFIFRSPMGANGPFAAAGWEFREPKLGKSTKDY